MRATWPAPAVLSMMLGCGTGAEEPGPAVDAEGPRPIAFDPGSSDLSRESKIVLRENARWIRGFPEATVIVEGCGDGLDEEEYELALSDRRAHVAWSFLLNAGVSPLQLEMLSQGGEHPFEGCEDGRLRFTVLWFQRLPGPGVGGGEMDDRLQKILCRDVETSCSWWHSGNPEEEERCRRRQEDAVRSLGSSPMIPPPEGHAYEYEDCVRDWTGTAFWMVPGVRDWWAIRRCYVSSYTAVPCAGLPHNP